MAKGSAGASGRSQGAGGRSGRSAPQTDLPSLRSSLLTRFPGLDLIVNQDRSGTIDLSKIVVPRSSRESGVGTQVMRELTRFADRNGVRIKLSPSSDFGGSKSRLVSFYKRFGFVENKGRNKDFTVRDSMYRDPESPGGD